MPNKNDSTGWYELSDLERLMMCGVEIDSDQTAHWVFSSGAEPHADRDDPPSIRRSLSPAQHMVLSTALDAIDRRPPINHLTDDERDALRDTLQSIGIWVDVWILNGEVRHERFSHPTKVTSFHYSSDQEAPHWVKLLPSKSFAIIEITLSASTISIEFPILQQPINKAESLLSTQSGKSIQAIISHLETSGAEHQPSRQSDPETEPIRILARAGYLVIDKALLQLHPVLPVSPFSGKHDMPPGKIIQLRDQRPAIATRMSKLRRSIGREFGNELSARGDLTSPPRFLELALEDFGISLSIDHTASGKNRFQYSFLESRPNNTIAVEVRSLRNTERTKGGRSSEASTARQTKLGDIASFILIKGREVQIFVPDDFTSAHHDPVKFPDQVSSPAQAEEPAALSNAPTLNWSAKIGQVTQLLEELCDDLQNGAAYRVNDAVERRHKIVLTKLLEGYLAALAPDGDGVLGEPSKELADAIEEELSRWEKWTNGAERVIAVSEKFSEIYSFVAKFFG